MAEVRIVTSIEAVGREAWDALFPGEIERFDYLLATEQAGLEGFAWRYLLAEDQGRLLAAAPAFVTDYALDTTLDGPLKHAAARVRRAFPRLLTLRMACLGSPCTETAQIGFASDSLSHTRPELTRAIAGAFEGMGRVEGCALLAVKDAPVAAQPLWNSLELRFRTLGGQPVARLPIAFADMDAYLAQLSAGTRRDMRRKLRSLNQVRIEVRRDLDGVLDDVFALYRDTLERAEMSFEQLTPAFFTGVLQRMGDDAFFVLYYVGDRLLAANLLLRSKTTLLDKFFCMNAEAGRRYNLYFLSWFTNVRLCLEQGLLWYQSGQAGYENKLRLGSVLERTTMFARLRNPVANLALRWVAPLFSAEPSLKAAA